VPDSETPQTIQGILEGKLIILGAHSIAHSEQKVCSSKIVDKQDILRKNVKGKAVPVTSREGP
jgi:hypothetical protein